MVSFLQAGWIVDGVDIALLAILQARRKVQVYGRAARVFSGSATNLEFLTGVYDAIYDIGCYHALHSEDKERYRENIKRLLQHNGYYLLYAYYQSSIMKNGINEDEINVFSQFMRIVNQIDSVDIRGRSAVFLEFRNEVSD